MENTARESILRDNMGMIQGICRRYLRNTEDCREMAQEVAARILSDRGGFRGESLASTWVYSIAKNACLQKLKKLSIERRRLGSYTLHLQVQDDTRPHIGPEIHVQLDQILSRLDALTRKIILLYAQDGLTHLEIGRILGVSRVAICRRMDRFRKKLHGTQAAPALATLQRRPVARITNPSYIQ
jgi:RNA polymerase sigma factor (sigma-70 family)